MGEIYRETEYRSYGDNIKNSIAGVVIGIIMFLLSFVILWNNEKNCAQDAAKISIVRKEAIVVNSNSVDRSNDNKLVMTSASAETTETLSDGIISVPEALALIRKVEMYQWEEKKHTKTEDQVGGGTRETTTYEYNKVWSEREINSGSFNQRQYSNPPMNIKTEKLYAQTGDFGAYKLTGTQTQKMKSFMTYSDLPYSYEYNIYGNYYYKGNSMSNPEIGDVRISYTYIPSDSKISVVGLQTSDDKIIPKTSKHGDIYMQYDGQLTLNDILTKFKEQSATRTNLFRLLGFILMLIGLKLIIDPVLTVLGFIPFVKHMASTLSFFVILIISLILSLITIAIAWLAYRPLLSLGLLALIAVLVYVVRSNINKNRI